jgi:hypothetical protein
MATNMNAAERLNLFLDGGAFTMAGRHLESIHMAGFNSDDLAAAICLWRYEQAQRLQDAARRDNLEWATGAINAALTVMAVTPPGPNLEWVENTKARLNT